MTEQVNVLRAAEERRTALDAIRRGDYDSASVSFNFAADLRTDACADPALIQELRIDASRAHDGAWSDMDTKKQWASRRSETKGRKRRYDD